jgi:hypothetical protein
MQSAPMTSWTLMASHGVVLFYIAVNPTATMREMSEALDLTERRIARIVKDLSEAEMLRIVRCGRRNSYEVNEDASFRDPTLAHVKLSSVVDAVCRRAQAGVAVAVLSAMALANQLSGVALGSGTVV